MSFKDFQGTKNAFLKIFFFFVKNPFLKIHFPKIHFSFFFFLI